MKRLFDLILALSLAIPALLVLSIAVIPAYIECRVNPFFVQTRVGRHQMLFKMIKLRTMYPATDDLASHQVSANSITRSGRFFRKTKIDELPQIWNVIVGEMSFVGPRPCLPSQTELREKRETRGVYLLVPGITGLAQIKGIDMSKPQELAVADAAYLGGWSLFSDVKLIIATAFGSGRGDAATTKNC
tara:strand:- start:744 stop:1307 length:564 start_codon:yes stop_codon:yes gene_type:complete